MGNPNIGDYTVMRENYLTANGSAGVIAAMAGGEVSKGMACHAQH
jgi:hypothetical protein